ncbi:unnamed protein product [Phytomonas sp. EM1]|nr:unnamed protein product [Phytomonas sp. EM1]|eukprot:CCW63591.1 unnamed protein product [Phytomonas sp. isolate EM1]
MSRASRLWCSFILVILIFSIVHCHLCLASDFDDPEIIDGVYFYPIFISGVYDNVVDGPSHVGVMCFPSLSAAKYGKESIVFCDMCGPGSAIRIINRSGIFTLTGSLENEGFVDGPPGIARFRGQGYGSNTFNGLSVNGDTIYIADTWNNAIRSISSEGVVQTLFDRMTKCINKNISYPISVSPYIYSSDSSSIIISDYGNKRILSAILYPTVSAPLLLAENIEAVQLSVTKDNQLLYYTVKGKPNVLKAISLMDNTRWDIGQPHCLGYKGSLALTSDESELLYYGISGNVTGVYSISTKVSPKEVETWCPKLKFKWPEKFKKICNVVTRDDTSWWVLTITSLYLVSTEPLDPDSGSGSSSGSGHNKRKHAIAAFPSDALPVNDKCLMSQFFNWVRVDVAIAYKTNDYLTQFEPLDDNRMLFPGSFNVSRLCGIITASKSKDGTITFLNFWGPPAMSPELTQDALTNSNWNYTKNFLDGQKGGKVPFCFIDCGNQCKTISFSEKLCVRSKSFSCDGVRKGMIASSVAMGTGAVVLFILMILSPSNVLTALMMIPII